MNMNIFDKASDGIYKAPAYLSYDTENKVKLLGLGVLILVLLILLLAIIILSKRKVKKLKREDNYDNLSDEDKKVKDVLYKWNKRDVRIAVVIVIVVLVGVGVFANREYSKYLSSNRFVYSEDIVNKLNEDNRNKVSEDVRSVEILGKATNYTNELFKKSHKELGNNYIGQYSNEYATLYNVKVTLKSGDTLELNAQLLPTATDEDKNKLTYIKGDKDEKLNGLITMTSDEIEDLTNK